MKVFYDSSIFSRQTFGGISRYIVDLINNLPDDVVPLLGLRASDNIYLDELKKKRAHVTLRHFPDHKKLSGVINHHSDKRIMQRGDYDIIHPTDYNESFLKYNHRPSVITVHDLIHNHLENYARPELVETIENSIFNADRLIAISHSTKKDLINFYGIDEEKISVVYHGYTPLSPGQYSNSPVKESYILYVGARAAYKNFNTFLEAFAILANEYPKLKLVCTGRKFTKAELKNISRLGLSGRIIQHLFSPQDMPGLYAGAECFVFPSKLEGFGIPILEAFAAKTPVVLSNATCFPEIAASAGIYFNPDDPASIAEKIRSAISDKELREQKIDLGTQRLKDFSWQKTGRKTAEVYRSLLAEKS